MTEVDETAIKAIDAIEHTKEPIRYLPINFDGKTIPVAAFYKGLDHGYELIDVKHESDKWLTAPERRTGTATALTLVSLIDLINRHKDAGSVVFANIVSADPSITAVIDYHELDGSARFGKHRIKYLFPLSDEWKLWNMMDGKPLSQLQLAEFLEDHIADLTSPTEQEKAFYEPIMFVKFGEPSAINILSRGLTINVNAVVSQANVLQSGEGQIRFEEKHTDEKGLPLSVPGLFMIEVPLFFGGAPIRVPVRLRYTKSGGGLTWKFSLYRPKTFVKNALEDDLTVIKGNTDLPLYEGSPEIG